MAWEDADDDNEEEYYVVFNTINDVIVTKYDSSHERDCIEYVQGNPYLDYDVVSFDEFNLAKIGSKRAK